MLHVMQKPGDLILILAGAEERTRKAISELRMEMATRLGLRKKMNSSFCGCLIFLCLNMMRKTTGG